MSLYDASLEEQFYRIRNTFLEFYEEKDEDDFDDFGPPTRQRSASAGPTTTRASSSGLERSEPLEQKSEMSPRGKPCQEHSAADKTGMQVGQHEGYAAKRGGGLREVTNSDAVVLSLANLTAPQFDTAPTTYSSQRSVSADDSVRGKPTNSTTSQETKEGSGENTGEKDGELTTAMIRHIACRYSQDDIASYLNDAGFAGKYNWIYLPMNPQKTANLGYVFVNFASTQVLEECRQMFDNQVFGPRQTNKRCQVTLALMQGPRVQRRSHRRGRDKKHQAEVASGEAEKQSCPKGFMDSCNASTAAHANADARLVLGA
jgi:hypothetical protein